MRKYIIINAPNSALPQIALRGFQMQKMTRATDSQPTPDRPSWFHVAPAVVMM